MTSCWTEIGVVEMYGQDPTFHDWASMRIATYRAIRLARIQWRSNQSLMAILASNIADDLGAGFRRVRHSFGRTAQRLEDREAAAGVLVRTAGLDLRFRRAHLRLRVADGQTRPEIRSR